MKEMSVGEYIKDAYLSPMGLTHKDLAKATGLSYSTVSMVFAEEYPLTLPIAVLFSKALGISVEQLAMLDGGREMIDQYDGVEVLYKKTLSESKKQEILERIDRRHKDRDEEEGKHYESLKGLSKEELQKRFKKADHDRGLRVKQEQEELNGR